MNLRISRNDYTDFFSLPDQFLITATPSRCKGLSRAFRQQQAPKERSPGNDYYIGGDFCTVHFIMSLGNQNANDDHDNAECEHPCKQFY